MKNNNSYLEKFNSGTPLSDKEYLALLLGFSGCKDCDASAAKLLDTYGSFSAVIDADPHLLMCGGTSTDAAVLFRLISRFAAICAAESPSDILTDCALAVSFFSSAYVGAVNEYITAAAVDKNMRITAVERISVGNSANVSAASRDIADFVVRNDSRCIFIAHNHPHASPEPSDADILGTETIIAALSKLGTALADHIIVSSGGGISMRKLGICKALTEQVCDGYAII